MSIIGEFHQYGSVLRHASRDSRIENMMNGLPRELQVELGWIDGVTHHGSGAAGQLHKYGRVAMLIDALPSTSRSNSAGPSALWRRRQTSSSSLGRKCVAHDLRRKGRAARLSPAHRRRPAAADRRLRMALKPRRRAS